MRISFSTIFLLIALSGVGQPPSLSDSIRSALSLEPRVMARFETRNSFITGTPVAVRGVQVGLAHGDRLNLGIGYHWLRKGVFQENDENREIRFGYLAPFVEYSFLYKRHWQVSIPLRLGIGYSRLRSDEGGSQGGAIILYEPAMAVEYRFLKYFGFGGGVGYRLMLLNNRDIDAQLTSAVYFLKFRFELGKLLNEDL